MNDHVKALFKKYTAIGLIPVKRRTSAEVFDYLATHADIERILPEQLPNHFLDCAHYNVDLRLKQDDKITQDMLSYDFWRLPKSANNSIYFKDYRGPGHDAIYVIIEDYTKYVFANGLLHVEIILALGLDKIDMQESETLYYISCLKEYDERQPEYIKQIF